MFSLVILLIASLALIQTAMLGINENLKNQIRDEAVNIVDMRLNQLRALRWTATTPTPTELNSANNGPELPLIARNFRNLSVQYSVTRTVADIPNTTSKQIALKVTWTYRGVQYSHGAATIVRRE